MRILVQTLYFVSIQLLLVLNLGIEVLHDLLVEEHVDLIDPESISNHHERGDQQRDVQQTAQETQVVDISKKLPRGQDFLIRLVQVPVHHDFRVRLTSFLRVRVVSTVMHAIASIMLPLGEV